MVHKNNGNHCDSRNLGYWANWKHCVHLRPSQNKRNTGMDLTFWRLMLKAEVLQVLKFSKCLHILSYFTASRCVRTHFDIIGSIRYNVSDCHRDAFCIRVSKNISGIWLWNYSNLNLVNLYLWVKNKLQMASIFYSNLNEAYYEHVYPYMVPIMLPIAQIAMTASVYMTVVTCFDRYCYSKLIIFIISRQ